MTTTKKTADDRETTIMGHVVQHDNSGVGHNWQTVDASELPPAIRIEIEGEIIDGKRRSGQIVGSNGLHYRWR